jgi:hypothetical protein
MEHHGKKYPCFQSAPLSVENKNKVLRYMRSCRVIAAAPGRMKDVFANTLIPGEMLAYSDGRYYWGTEAIYYFDKYDMKLPDDFINRVIH